MRKRILIADDNDVVRGLIRASLERRTDLEICETSDGRETVATAVAVQPDLAILDVVMPELNGIEVASILKKNAPTTKIILFTMYGDYVGKKLASTAGVHVILSKPEGLGSLMQVVNSLLSQGPQEPNQGTANSKKTSRDAEEGMM